MRGKDSDSQIWEYLNPDAEFQSHSFYCDGADQLCTYFPVGFIPRIEYSMYDVAILVKPSDPLLALKNTSINFHIAYMNPEYTAYQLTFRAIFTCVTLFVMCFYCTKVLCRVPA